MAWICRGNVGCAALVCAFFLNAGCGLANTCGDPKPREVELMTSEGEVRLVLADAYFEIADDKDACVGFMEVELAGGPEGACGLRLTTTAGERGSRKATVTGGSLQATDGCDLVPNSVRGEYQLDEAGMNASFIKLRGLPEEGYLGTWCLLDGMKVHVEGTFVQTNPPASGDEAGVESFDLEPTEFKISGEIFGDKRTARCVGR